MGTQFGGPGGGRKIQKPIPPERGSFPLDHDAECKSFMTDYLACIKKNRGHNATECRVLSKGYLACRMEHNLMAPDEFKNLGYGEDFDASVKSAQAGRELSSLSNAHSTPNGAGDTAEVKPRARAEELQKRRW